MKICWLVTSAIDIENRVFFNDKIPRTAFGTDERFRQTQFTINNINLVCPNSKIFIVDISKNFEHYRKLFAYKSNVEYVSIEELDSESAELCRTHKSRGLTESTLIDIFMQRYADQIKQYDYMIKMSGRYFHMGFDTSVLNEQNRDKFFFRYIKAWPWEDEWNYSKEFAIDDKLHWAETINFGVGRDLIDYFAEGMSKMRQFYIDFPNYGNMDFEVIMFFVVRHRPIIQPVEWPVGGWRGGNGEFVEW